MKIKCLTVGCRQQIELTPKEENHAKYLNDMGFVLSKQCPLHQEASRISEKMAEAYCEAHLIKKHPGTNWISTLLLLAQKNGHCYLDEIERIRQLAYNEARKKVKANVN